MCRESIKEDDEGLVESAVAEIIQKAKRKRQMMKRGHRRLGMMRHLNLIIDCSESMSFPDLKPTRMLCTAKVLFTRPLRRKRIFIISHFVNSFSKFSSKSFSTRIQFVRLA